MSTAFSRRFTTLIDQFSAGNKRQFALLTGKSPSHIYRICRGLSRPSVAYLEHLYSLFNIDLNWLLTGEQPVEQSAVSGSGDMLMVPKLDVEASAGFGSINGSEDITEQFALNKRWLSTQLGVHSEQLAFVTIRGDSMLPTLQHGDMVLVDLSQRDANKRGVFVLQTEDGLMAKRLQQHRDHISVVSDNPEYPAWQIHADNAQQHGIAGRIVWCGRSM
ncbi:MULTISPECIES: XRE family transcriptional regulator [Pseudoalteromonas]|uniref:LexA family transcriptional repressor n=2 Tax=Pseudoalteromonas TaxID=53246 RepID=A0A4V2E3T2_9GAMM|nr:MULTISPECIES: XRE family transcriptional regulator [Pseudoalteromonas]QTL36713.1 helix-turn-helix transcriptional regulator [Pseudoalteromonas viridis]RZM83552.1 LexA family transcriptional repressor [Pseudoalteromonas rubra]